VAPVRVAVVGAGPAGFYAAGGLLDAGLGIEVDVIERLPTPWGLVRLGVAPDHPRIKAVSSVFERIAARPGFRFLGNVEAGRDLRHSELADCYDAVVYAVGAQADRRLGIPGEDMDGSWPASAFVGWYNGHPDYAGCDVDLACERAVVVGNGNVALDIARMLALEPAALAETDIADEALHALAASRVREIVVVGRRGPVQASFTTAELRELGALSEAGVVVDPADLVLDPASEATVATATTPRRNLELLREWAGRPRADAPRTIRLRFLCSPVALHGDHHRVEAIELVHNRLEVHRGTSIAEPTDEHETLPCGLVVRSAGYRGTSIPGVPFDERHGTIANDAGRVRDLPGAYCTGWIKRGPSGVIGTNKRDAAETVENVLADLAQGRLQRVGAPAEAVDTLLAARGIEVVDDAAWHRIDEAERREGELEGRPRVKLCRWEELLATARAEQLAALA
jgi:ferredoxin--NADP+ reductase